LPILQLGSLTAPALVIHAITLASGRRNLCSDSEETSQPHPVPLAPEFFPLPRTLSLFGPILAVTSRLTHLPIDWSIFAWYVRHIVPMLASCWMLTSACLRLRAPVDFHVVLTTVLAHAATNTALLLMDPY